MTGSVKPELRVDVCSKCHPFFTDDIANLTPEQANDLLNFIHSLGQSDPDENNPNILLTRHMAQLIRDLDTSRAITAGCGLSWCAPLESRSEIEALVVAENMDHDGFYEIPV